MNRSLDIAIDARWLVGGIGTYTRGLLEGLSAHPDAPRVRVITRRQHLDYVQPLFTDVAVVDMPIYGVREQFAVPRAANGCRFLHVPHFNVPLFHARELIVTIHDLILTTVSPYKDTASSRFYANPMLQLAARTAAHIITVSEYSKQQIVEHLRIDPSRLTVIYNGVRPCFRPCDVAEARHALSEAFNLHSRYLLFVGNLKPHKNVRTLLQAFAVLRSQRKCLDKKLLLVGDDSKENASVRAAIESLGLSGVVIHIAHLPEKTLVQAYSAADALVMPSTSEGFGLPVVEAMACGTPVICSRIPALSEVAGDAASFFDPASAEELAAAIDGLLSSPEQQRALRAKGLARVAEFSSRAFVGRHIELYNWLSEAKQQSREAALPARETCDPPLEPIDR